jgi:uncharacterized protein involved in copper resistance
MLTKTKLALAAALVLSATLSASAATKPRVVAHADQAATYDAIPGYDKDGNTVGIPNPERSQSQR